MPAAIWALRAPPSPSEVATEVATLTRLTTPKADESLHADDEAPLDADVFTVKLWNPPQTAINESQLTSQSTNRREPLRLELIGIIQEHGVRKAALYDPDTDRLRIVAGGEKLNEYTIGTVTRSAVTLDDGLSKQTIELRDPPRSLAKES